MGTQNFKRTSVIVLFFFSSFSFQSLQAIDVSVADAAFAVLGVFRGYSNDDPGFRHFVYFFLCEPLAFYAVAYGVGSAYSRTERKIIARRAGLIEYRS